MRKCKENERKKREGKRNDNSFSVERSYILHFAIVVFVVADVSDKDISGIASL